ncbi:hypothetical protein [Salinibacillus xinjiangensis]|nr:hypothetical protein [Salinibacillus xinjiangensis]
MKNISYVLLITLILSIIIVNFDSKEQKVIKYFPFDESKEFTETSTNLKLLTEMDEDSYKIQWDIYSQLTEPVYLRQDISLLFVDGKLKGILNQWKEEANALTQKTVVNGEDSSHYEAITFHHGEVHYPDDVIKSIQDMTYDELYVIDSPHAPLESFKEPVEKNEKEWEQTLDHAKNQTLNYYWNELMNYYDLSAKDFLEIPLVNLWKYKNNSFPTLTNEQTRQVIGQLWEGLYKNYVTGIPSHNDHEFKAINTYMPIILVDHKGEFIFVLFKDPSGQHHRLIQRIPDFS